MSILKEKYNNTIRNQLKEKLNKSNIFMVPKIESVVVSVGIGKFKDDKSNIESIVSQFERIVGQKPYINISRKAVSAYKLRIGQTVGLSATLRGDRMYDFLDKIIGIALPRVRDFRGIKVKSFDGNGNIAIGIKEHIIISEIKYEDVKELFGFQINIKTSANTDKDAKALLEMLGFPFEKVTKAS